MTEPTTRVLNPAPTGIAGLRQVVAHLADSDFRQADLRVLPRGLEPPTP